VDQKQNSNPQPEVPADSDLPGWVRRELTRRVPPTAPATSEPGAAATAGRSLFRTVNLALVLAILVAGGYLVSVLLEGSGEAPLEAGRPQVTNTPPAQGPVRGSGSGREPVAAVARAVLPSVVKIETGGGVGSGVVYDADGFILTAAHVVENASEVTVRLADGSRLPGDVVGSDANTDVAVVRVSESGNLEPATLGVGAKVRVGQLAVAIGSPFGLEQTVTSGIVSAVGRTVVNNSGNSVPMLQTDASINPGNSGGALVDRKGRVVGINDSIRTNSGISSGVGFAIPIDTAVQVADALVGGRTPQSGFLGVSGAESSGGQAGAVVTEVQPGSPASDAGLRVGDLLTRYDGQALTSMDELVGFVRATQPGTRVEIEVVRNGRAQSIEVRIGSQ
jgi:putative serine protease PepD